MKGAAPRHPAPRSVRRMEPSVLWARRRPAGLLAADVIIDIYKRSFGFRRARGRGLAQASRLQSDLRNFRRSQPSSFIVLSVAVQSFDYDFRPYLRFPGPRRCRSLLLLGYRTRRMRRRCACGGRSRRRRHHRRTAGGAGEELAVPHCPSGRPPSNGSRRMARRRRGRSGGQARQPSPQPLCKRQAGRRRSGSCSRAEWKADTLDKQLDVERKR
jgi:hypothetical protein